MIPGFSLKNCNFKSAKNIQEPPFVGPSTPLLLQLSSPLLCRPRSTPVILCERTCAPKPSATAIPLGRGHLAPVQPPPPGRSREVRGPPDPLHRRLRRVSKRSPKSSLRVSQLAGGEHGLPQAAGIPGRRGLVGPRPATQKPRGGGAEGARGEGREVPRGANRCQDAKKRRDGRFCVD